MISWHSTHISAASGQAGAAFLLPGLLNGYGKIERRLGAIEGRLTRIERGLGIESR